MIFDTTTWQEIAVLEGHSHFVNGFSLSPNNRILASASDDKTHKSSVQSAAFSADGKLLVTGSYNNIHTWDIHAILKEAGLEDLLQPLPDVAAQESFMDADATQAEDDELSPGFFNDVTDGAYSSRTYGNHHRSSSRRPRTLAPSLGSVSALIRRLSLPFRHSQPHTNEETKLPQHSGRAIFSRHRPRVVEVAAVKDREKKHSSKANRTPKSRPRHRLLQLLILPHHVQDMRIHYPSDCWVISCFFSAAHLLNTSMEMYNQRSSKIN
ncbi:uncharacterized protein F5891DRAFT_488502 [Suillus fuscotomentosus]|uniref:Uncharacterized protein n=1 Tax=Suillus fuscotomentosus TaxID=1912939 RepID=A0AAD4E1Z5_9AGAM|nr:uncharacterized protein F5891DRAFT_488502 [Suillus fuscotomentosus]KAG1898132.1 hypothetical protein F5891DRAFT_488502 [Suillus fuscotomentosus]